MFEVNNDVAKINGVKGKYDDKTVTNPSVKYGMNAANNYYSYLEAPIVNDKMNPAPILDFGISPKAQENNAEKIEGFIKENDAYLASLPPLEFEYRYMPNITNGKIDTNALLGAAYEEMGQKKSIPVKDMDTQYAIDSDMSYEPLDINKDGNVDVGEFGTTMLAADMLSKSETPDTKNIDGTINQKGANAILAYNKKSNADAARALYSGLYNAYNLNNASKDFNP